MILWLKNKEKTQSIFIYLVIISLVILFINIYFWQNILIGVPWTICLFLILSIWLGEIFSHFFNWGKEFRFFAGLFLTFYLIAFGLAVPIVFFKITPVYFYLFLLVLTLIVYWLSRRLSANIQISSNIQIEKKRINIHSIFYVLFSIFYLAGWCFIFKARTGDYILSPWDVLSKYYQVIWFGLAFSLVLIIFSRAKLKTILFLIILTSFLFHAYLPFVSENSFGVDRWRHVGAERRLMRGDIELPALIGEVDYVKVGPISVPRVFVMPNKFSYSNQWGMTIGLSWLTCIDILKIDQYLIWFLWSIFFTIFVYKLAQIIFGTPPNGVNSQAKLGKEKLSLLIAFVALFCFFSLQVGGAITVPHAIGFLLFLFFLLIFFSYLKNRSSFSVESADSGDNDRKLWPLIIFTFVLLIFNYVLYLILALEIFVLGLILKSKGLAKKIILPILIIVFIFSLPLLDRASGTSFFVYEPLEALKKLPQKLIEFTNPISYFYYKFGETSYLPNLIKNFKWQMIFPPLVFIFAIIGFLRYSGLIRFNSSNIREITIKILAIFLFVFAANQFISFSFMKNYRLLSMRLGNVLMLFLVFFFTAGLYWLIKNTCVKYHDRDKKHVLGNGVLTIIILAVFLAGLSITTYASGPAYGNVTNDELTVARYLDQEIMAKRSCGCRTKQDAIKEFCVFDAGWRLLALESVNGMIAGNFPTDSVDFVQKEKDELYRQMLKNPSREILNQTLQITGAKRCFFIANQSWLKPEVFDKTKELLGEPTIKNNTYIWQYSR